MQWTEKYRPKCISDIVGQQKTIKIIDKMMNNGGLSHILLFGPPGTGKTTTVYAIVNQLLGNSVAENFIEINASDERSLDMIRRKVIEAARYMPLDPSKPRIIFLDEADGLGRDTQEALRKPLEQAGRTHIILAANKVERFAKSILSRLMSFEFIPLAPKHIQARLKKICRAEHITIPEEAIKSISSESKGDIRHAINELQKEAMLL